MPAHAGYRVNSNMIEIQYYDLPGLTNGYNNDMVASCSEVGIIIMRKRFSILIILSLLLLPLVTLFPAQPVSAADISGTVTYSPSGSIVGTYIGASTTIATFTPTANVTAGSNVILTFPAGTVLNDTFSALSDFTIVQAGGGGVATAPSAMAANVGAGLLQFTVAAASLDPGLGDYNYRYLWHRWWQRNQASHCSPSIWVIYSKYASG